MKQRLTFIFLFLINFIGYAAPLPANQVFQIRTQFVDANTFIVDWDIKPGYFIYKERIAFKVDSGSNLALAAIQYPKTLIKRDKQGKSYAIYRNNLLLTINVLGEHPGESLVKVHYQGCSDEGFCYPPEVRQIKLSINKELAVSAVNLETVPIKKNAAASHQDKITVALRDHHWLVSFVLFFGFGLLLSFTPCVLPMVPVLSGIIVGQGKKITTRKAFLLSLSYVLSMSLTYSLVGAGIALLGQNLQMTMQSPWAISLFSLTFVLLSLSMFGLYELRLPTYWQTKLSGLTRSKAGGHYLGAAIMGSLSILILSPCVTAPLIGVLGYVANSGNIILGISALFFLGLGMGTPLLLIGTQAGRWLPSAGHWMVVVKGLFGFMLLAIAIYLMSRILPAALIMALWSAFFIFFGIYCGAFQNSQSRQQRFYQGFGIILLLYGLLILISASMGQTNPLQPLAVFKVNINQSTLPPQTIVRNVSELQEAIRQAKGKPVFVDFYADWCTACKVMEATIFQDPRLQQALKNFVWLKVDISANTEQEKELLRKYEVIAPPTFLFFDINGQAIPAATLAGELSLQTFLERLDSFSK